MELTKLKYFQTTARLQHVTRAAEELHVAQPALTKAIKDLEEELGAPLFYKTGRNVRLTPQGIFLKEKLDSILPTIEELPRLMSQFSEREKRTIRLNILAASTVVTDAVVAYRKKRADSIFEVIQNEEELLSDVTVTTDGKHVDRHDVADCTVLEEAVFLAVPRQSAYNEKGTLCLEDVKDEGFVMLAGSRLFRAKCDELCKKAGFIPTVVFESDSPIAVRNVIGAGAGVGFYPAFSWGKTLHKEVSLLPVASPVCKRDITIALYGQAKGTLAEDFYRFLTRFLQKRQKAAVPEKKQE